MTSRQFMCNVYILSALTEKNQFEKMGLRALLVTSQIGWRPNNPIFSTHVHVYFKNSMSNKIFFTLYHYIETTCQTVRPKRYKI